MEKEITFEEALNRLNEITNTIQRNDCSLDDSLKLFEEGIKLSKYCSEILDKYQVKLNEMSKGLVKGNEE